MALGDRNSKGKCLTTQQGWGGEVGWGNGGKSGRGSGFFPEEVTHHVVEREAKSAR